MLNDHDGRIGDIDAHLNHGGTDEQLDVASFEALEAAYRKGIDWEEPEGLESRAAKLLAAFLLARIDGKSPVEYLTTEEDRDCVRQFALQQSSRSANQ